VGPISMDINPGVPQYGQRTDAALKDAETFVEYLINPEFSSQSRLMDEGNEEGLVLPVITPRYLPTCSLDLLKGLGDIATRHRCHVQSHVSESLDVMEEVERQYPGRRDLDLFHDAGLLTRNTILAHGVHLNDNELDILRETGSGIAHCPLSNFYFANGHLDVRRVNFAHGVNIGLGYDVSEH